MHPLLLIIGVMIATVLALTICFFGIAWLMKIFGQEKVERFIKFRMQGPFVPAPKADNTKKSASHPYKNGT